MVLIVWGPLLVLAVVCVITLDELPPPRRRGLLPLSLVMMGLAAALFGGAWVLGRHGLAWRLWVQEGMFWALWLVGLASGASIIVYARRWMSRLGGGMRAVMTGLCALCLTSILLSSGFTGLLWTGIHSEQMGTYQGRKVVQDSSTFLERSYAIYEYRGPLVRGGRSIAWGEAPLLDGRCGAGQAGRPCFPGQDVLSWRQTYRKEVRP